MMSNTITQIFQVAIKRTLYKDWKKERLRELSVSPKTVSSSCFHSTFFSPFSSPSNLLVLHSLCSLLPPPFFYPLSFSLSRVPSSSALCTCLLFPHVASFLFKEYSSASSLKIHQQKLSDSECCSKRIAYIKQNKQKAHTHHEPHQHTIN